MSVRNLEQNRFESQRPPGRQTKFVVMVTASIPEYFLSSSEDDDELSGFLSEEINGGRIQGLRADSDVSVDEVLSSDEESLEAPIVRGETEDEGWNKERTSLFLLSLKKLEELVYWIVMLQKRNSFTRCFPKAFTMFLLHRQTHTLCN